jgi:hypothetical protein
LREEVYTGFGWGDLMERDHLGDLRERDHLGDPGIDRRIILR